MKVKVPIGARRHDLLSVMLNLERKSFAPINALRQKDFFHENYIPIHHFQIIKHLDPDNGNDTLFEKLVKEYAAKHQAFDINIERPIHTKFEPPNKYPTVRLPLKSQILLDLRRQMMERLPDGAVAVPPKHYAPKEYTPNILLPGGKGVRDTDEEAEAFVKSLEAEKLGPLKAVGLILGNLDDVYGRNALPEPFSRWKYFPFRGEDSNQGPNEVD
ncbi:uncharacterized protein PAC_12839 [Phialocephala subalpina]|uniref:Uncharacterized protein n=1 Tax=Phialocephala subalpina TaxID=576137 RepID=A0A1L7XD44_9HELO|nr:uncharacterized protein PAC_12839 [Phialocephala subalpina]